MTSGKRKAKYLRISAPAPLRPPPNTDSSETTTRLSIQKKTTKIRERFYFRNNHDRSARL
jgi:hypothetical protein